MQPNNLNFSSQNNKINITYKPINTCIDLILILIAFLIPMSTSLTSLLFSIFIALWIIEKNFTNKIQYIWRHPSCFLPFIILISLILGCTYSIASWEEIILYLKKMSKLIYLPLLVFYFKDSKLRSNVMNAIITASLVTTFIGLIYYYFFNYSIYIAARVFKNTIDTSLITTLATFLLIYKISFRENKFTTNLLLVLSISMNIFYLLFVTQGRTSQLIFLILINLIVFQKIKNKFLAIGVALFIFMISLVSLNYFNNSFKDVWSRALIQYNNYKLNVNNDKENSISQRLSYYKNTFSLIKEKPFLGWGTGSFVKAYKNFIINNKNDILTTNPHNEYLLFATQLGLLGLVLLIYFFYNLLRASFILTKPNERHLLQVITATMSIGCLSNSWLLDFTAGHIFIFLTAVCLGALPSVELNRNN